MKIENDRIGSVIQNVKAAVLKADDPSAARAAGGESAGTDRVSFGISREIDHYRKILDAMPEVRSAKVDDLKPEVAAGTYHVESSLVARKMLETSW